MLRRDATYTVHHDIIASQNIAEMSDSEASSPSIQVTRSGEAVAVL